MPGHTLPSKGRSAASLTQTSAALPESKIAVTPVPSSTLTPGSIIHTVWKPLASRSRSSPAGSANPSGSNVKMRKASM